MQFQPRPLQAAPSCRAGQQACLIANEVPRHARFLPQERREHEVEERSTDAQQRRLHEHNGDV